MAETIRVNEINASPETVAIAKKSFYVDDGLYSITDVATGVKLTTELIELMASGGFNVKKFISNNKELLQSLNRDLLTSDLKDLNIGNSVLPEHKVLGVVWNSSSDETVKRVNLHDKPETKRGLWSMICQIYDLSVWCHPIC